MKTQRVYLLVVLCICVFTKSFAQIQTPKYVTTTANSNGYYEYLPAGYNNNQTYPLLIFIHGLGELGDGSSGQLPKILYHGVPKLINAGQFPASFTVGGQSHSFIVISPQFKGWPVASDINNVINYAIQNYKVNQNRIYVTGLSMGGGVTWEFAGAYASRVAAIVPVCGASWPDQARAQSIASAKVAVWATHNDFDGTVPSFYTKDYVNYINQNGANPAAIKSIWPNSSHDAWSQTYNPNYKENNMNIYEWMLQYSKNGTPLENQLPSANAGSDQAITLPINSVSLSGSGSDPDGTIATYSWSKISGPTGNTITASSSASTTVTNLVQGVYTFRLTVTDNLGATANDDVMITVNAAANQSPTANAGSDQAITLPTSSVSLSGSGSDPDGTIATYSWNKISGPTENTITTSSSASTTVTDLVQGVYTFRLTVTDNLGATASDDVMITVNAAVNQSPTANAGSDQTITLPINSLSLSGSGSDPDGTIATYSWSKISGPTGNIITTSSSASTTVTDLVQGVYTFRLTVTDNLGATTTDDIVITVNAAVNQTPTANAGPDQTITLPTNSVNLSGSGSDADGTITTYEWSKISGPPGNIITTSSSASTTVTDLVQGVYTFQLIVTDNLGATATDDVMITVNAAANQLPTANAGSDQTIILPTSSVSLSGSGSDPDGTIATYEWSKISGPTGNTITTSSSASTTVTDLMEGVYTFRLTVTDNQGATATDDVEISVNVAGNQLPTANAGSDQTITLPTSSVSLSGSGSDTDGTIATYEWSQISGPTGNTITTSSSASTTVTDLMEGVYTFRLTVTDNQGATATDDIVITVNVAGNQLPTANAGSDQTITLPTSSVSLSGSGSDTDGTIATYEWSQISGPTGNTITTSSSASTTVTDLVEGVYTFRLTVTDNLGATATDDVEISVNAAGNQLPTANAGPDQTITLPTNSGSLSGSGSDPDGTITTHSWTKISGPSANTFTTPSSASTTVTDLVQGAYIFRLTVTDNQGATATDDVEISVNAAANQLPTAIAGPDQTITLPTNSVSLSGSGSDPDGTSVTNEWSKISGPSGYIITNSFSTSTTVTDLVEGVYTFRLTVTDTLGATATDDVVITVNAAANQLPTANAGSDQTITLPTNSVSLSGSGSDPDGTIATYAWSQISGPSGSIITTSTSASTTITNLVQGVYTFQLTVTDNLGATASEDVVVTVKAAPYQAPTANNFSSYLPYDGQYSYGLNPGWYGFNWNTRQVCDLGAGNAAKGVKGIGAKSFRMALYDDFLTQWGKDILIPDYEHLKNLGTSEITAFVGAPHSSHKWDTAFYNGYDSMSKVFRGMYEPVWLDSARTQINPANTYAKYLYETVKTYGDYVTFWEVVNEPDFSYGSGGWFGDIDPPIPGSWFDRDPTPQELVNLRAPIQYYIRMLRISWDVIKKLQPNDYVCTGGIGARSFLAALLRNTDNPDGGKVTAEYPLKAGAYFDVLSFHTYPEFTLKEWSNDNGGGFKYFRHSDAAIKGHLTVKNRMDSMLKVDGYNGNQYPEKQFICTETGISRVMDNDNLGSNEAQKNYMIKAHVMTQKDGQVKQTYWYQTADASNSNYHWDMFGCYYYFGDKQPFNAIATDQGVALKTTSDLLYGKTYDPGRTIELNLPSSIDGAAFKGTDGSYVYVLWAKTKNDLSEISSANYNFPSLIAGNNNLKRKEWNYSQTASNVVVGLSNIVLSGTPSFFEITTDTLSVPNIAPTANAGLDKTITLPTSNVSLTGSGIDPDGAIVSYAWTKISGPSANTITSPAAAATTITGLVQGVYNFRLTVTDNKGITATDDVVVTVNAAGNKSPSANAGPDQTITLPQTSVSLSGSGTDPDGTIVSYAWTKISGPSTGIITTPAAAASTVTSLVQGVYIFRLTATDNLGAKASDDMVITVNAANQSPIVNAGIDKTITLPLNSVTLNGSGTDIDGSISSYSWSQVAGPSQAVIVSTNQVSTVVNSLVQGVYQFTLVITDNLGAIGKDTVRVTVNPAINKPPIANAGDDLSITLPVNNANLNGSGTDADGNIVSYLWTKLNGPVSHTISSSSTASTSVTALVEGIYTFRLTVTDNKGASASDEVRVIVNGVAPAHNVPPVAKAGKDTTLTLPVNHIQITGTGTDVDGTVTAYVWSMINGPANCQISSPSAPKTNITGLVEGTYQFKLTVFDNIGASGSDLVTVIVKPKVKTKSSALVYPNPATSEINIKIEALTEKDNSTIRIYNSFGSIVYSEEFIRTEYILIKQIDISRLAKGVYFVTVNADANTDITLKFIKL